MLLKDTSYNKFYYLEHYITTDVRDSFLKNGYLTVFDFFCIIIWKANRAKSKVAKTLLSQNSNLDTIIKDLSGKIFLAFNDKEKFKILIVYHKFRLPIASAILSVLYPNNFAVYDVRVCETFPEYKGIDSYTSFEKLWISYQGYIQSIRQYEVASLSLWEKEKILWGKSFYEQLQKDIATNFISKHKKSLKGR